MAWRVAKSLLELMHQVDALAPNRSKGSDGTIGDEHHASRSSDHNPWVIDSHGMPVVTAMDITHDPRHGVDSYAMADALRKSHDERIKYIISNHRIASSTKAPWTWRPYYGENPHDHHFHLSVVAVEHIYDDMSPWSFGQLTPNTNAPEAEDKPTLRKGSSGADVSYLQTLLKIDVTGDFDDDTQDEVIEFQKHHGLGADGVVGPVTWKALLESQP